METLPPAHKTSPHRDKAFSCGGGAPAGKHSREKRVRFHKNTKPHDWLSEAANDFWEYMRDVFRKIIRPNGETTVSIAAKKLDVNKLAMLRAMLLDLMERCEKSPTGCAPILPRGGGNLGSIEKAHFGYLQSHVEYLDTVIGKVQIVIKQRAAQVNTTK